MEITRGGGGVTASNERWRRVSRPVDSCRKRAAIIIDIFFAIHHFSVLFAMCRFVMVHRACSSQWSQLYSAIVEILNLVRTD